MEKFTFLETPNAYFKEIRESIKRGARNSATQQNVIE